MREKTGARVIFPSSEDTDQETIVIIGKKESVDEAKKELESLIKNLVGTKIDLNSYFLKSRIHECKLDTQEILFWGHILLASWKFPFFFFIKDNVVEGEMHVDPKHHRYFVARRGEVLKHIGDEFGGVTVSFPRSGVKSDKVVIKGSKDCVEGAKRRIQEIVEDLVCLVNKHMLKIFAWCKTLLLMIINIIENWLFLHSCIVHYCFCSV